MTISIHFKWRQRGLCARRRFEKIIISVGLSRIFQWEIINGAQDYELLRLTCSSANKRISNQLKIVASTNCHKMSQFEGNRICHGLITGDMRELSQSVSFRHSRPRPKFRFGNFGVDTAENAVWIGYFDDSVRVSMVWVIRSIPDKWAYSFEFRSRPRMPKENEQASTVLTDFLINFLKLWSPNVSCFPTYFWRRPTWAKVLKTCACICKHRDR